MNKIGWKISLSLSLIVITQLCYAQNANNMIQLPDSSYGIYALLVVIVLLFLVGLLYQYSKFIQVIVNEKKREKEEASSEYSNYLNNLNSREIDIYLKSKTGKRYE